MTHRTLLTLSLGLALLTGCQATQQQNRIEIPKNATLMYYGGEDASFRADWPRNLGNGRIYFYSEKKGRVTLVVPLAAGVVPSLSISEGERVYFAPDNSEPTSQPTK